MIQGMRRSSCGCCRQHGGEQRAEDKKTITGGVDPVWWVIKSNSNDNAKSAGGVVRWTELDNEEGKKILVVGGKEGEVEVE